MPKKYDYPEKEYILLSEEFHGVDHEDIEELRESYFALRDLNGFENPSNMGEEVMDMIVYLYKNVVVNANFKNVEIAVGLREKDEYTKMVVAEGNNEFEDFNFKEASGDAIYFFLEQFASDKVFELYEELLVVQGLFTEAEAELDQEVKSIKDIAAKERYKEIGQRIKGYIGTEVLLQMNTTNNANYLEKIIEAFHGVIAFQKDRATEVLRKEKISILNTIVRGNEIGLFYKMETDTKPVIINNYKGNNAKTPANSKPFNK